LDESLYEEVGEHEWIYPGLKAEQKKDLTATIKTWFVDNKLLPNYFKIDNIRPLTISIDFDGGDNLTVDILRCE